MHVLDVLSLKARPRILMLQLLHFKVSPLLCYQTATVLEVMKGLRAKVDKDELPPYRFVEINGLRLPSPEHAYTVCP